MAQIQTYPRKTAYDANDLILICDKTPDANGVVTNDTKTTTISTIADNLNVVETLNSLKGDVSITGGTNITVTPSGQNIEISTSASNVDGSGTAGTIPKWSDSNTLTDSIIKDQGGVDLLIPRFIKHDGDTNNLFGFNDVGKFLVSVDATAEDQFSVEADSIIMKTDSGTKIAAGPKGVTLYSDTSDTALTTSHRRLATSTSGVIIYGQSVSEGAAAEMGGAIRYYNNASNRYVGISGPVTTGTNYTLRLPDSVGTANQVLKLNSPIISGSTQELVWSNVEVADGITGSVQFKSSTGQFNGDSALKYSGANSTITLTVGDAGNDRAGTIEIQSNENGGILKIGGGSQTHYTSIKGSDSDTASYDIILPPAGPGGNNKILESTSAGVLSWIDTPGGGITPTAEGGTGSAISSAAVYNVLIGNGSSGESSAFGQSGDNETAIQLPVGATSRRPTANATNVGLIRYNSQLAKFEGIVETSVGSGTYSWVSFDVTS